MAKLGSSCWKLVQSALLEGQLGLDQAGILLLEFLIEMMSTFTKSVVDLQPIRRHRPCCGNLDCFTL